MTGGKFNAIHTPRPQGIGGQYFIQEEGSYCIHRHCRKQQSVRSFACHHGSRGPGVPQYRSNTCHEEKSVGKHGRFFEICLK